MLHACGMESNFDQTTNQSKAKVDIEKHSFVFKLKKNALRGNECVIFHKMGIFFSHKLPNLAMPFDFTDCYRACFGMILSALS